MTSNQPLSYPTWESVIPYLSISQRLVLSKRCPALEKFNNRIPLRIKYVQVTERGININNDEVNYILGVITIYPGYTPNHIQVVNNAGGYTTDVGKIGGKCEADPRIKELEEDIEKQESLIKVQLSYERTEWTARFLRAFENKIIKLRAEIKEVRKKGYTLPYSYNLQVISNTQFGKIVERVKYTKKISLARYYLLRELLPRNMSILVDTLEVHDPWLTFSGRSIRRLVYPNYVAISQFSGRSELHFEEVFYPEIVIRDLLNCQDLNEKHITVGLVDRIRGDAVMGNIRTLPGAQMRNNMCQAMSD